MRSSPTVGLQMDINARDVKGTEKHASHLQQDIDEVKDSEASNNARRKTGSIITVLGSALANFSDGYQQNLASSTNVIFNRLLCKEV